MNPSAAFFCLCMVAVYSTGEKANKTKRDVSGLYPFPRVGRGDVLWNSRIFGPREVKRQGLIPFPRVGRNGDDNSAGKRDASENGGGMWFGPRLGRLQKRSRYDSDDAWALVQVKDFPLARERLRDSSLTFDGESSEEADPTRDYRM